MPHTQRLFESNPAIWSRLFMFLDAMIHLAVAVFSSCHEQDIVPTKPVRQLFGESTLATSDSTEH